MLIFQNKYELGKSVGKYKCLNRQPSVGKVIVVDSLFAMCLPVSTFVCCQARGVTDVY